MKLKIKQGTTSKIIRVYVEDVGGEAVSGLTHASSGLVARYSRVGDSSSTAISLVDCTVGTYTSGGFKAVDSVNMPGVYELHLPNACLTGSDTVHIVLRGAENMSPVLIEIELDGIDYSVGIGQSVWSELIPGSYVAGEAGYILNQVLSKSLVIGAGLVTVTSPVTQEGDIPLIVIGDDYKSANGRAFSWTLSPGNFTIPGATATFIGYLQGNKRISWSVAGTVADAGGGNITVAVEMDKDDTTGLPEGRYDWYLEIVDGTENITASYGDTFLMNRRS